MFLKKPGKAHSRLGSLIGAGTRIVGDVIFEGGLRLDGEIQGNVSAPNDPDATLVLGSQGRIDGRVTVPHVLVNGTVNGPIIATEFAELQPHARVAGNIYYKGISMQPGAVVDGHMVHCVSNENSGELELVYDDAGDSPDRIASSA